jgi:protein-tyrosine phosphatase
VLFSELYSLDCPAYGRLSIMARPCGGDWLADEIAALRQAGVDVLVSLLTPTETAELDLTEEVAECSRQALEFLALPIEDRGVPASMTQVAALVDHLDAALRQGKHVALHCRQGIGRSSLIAACVLAKRGLSVDDVFEQLATVRGRPVPDTDQQRAWVSSFHRLQAFEP